MDAKRDPVNFKLVQSDQGDARDWAGVNVARDFAVEAILNGRQPVEMTLAVLMRLFAVGWRE